MAIELRDIGSTLEELEIARRLMQEAGHGNLEEIDKYLSKYFDGGRRRSVMTAQSDYLCLAELDGRPVGVIHFWIDAMEDYVVVPVGLAVLPGEHESEVREKLEERQKYGDAW